MTLLELSAEYRSQADALRERVRCLELCAAAEKDEEKRLLLRWRIRTLHTMWREARDLAVLTARYYDRGYHHSERYTI